MIINENAPQEVSDTTVEAAEPKTTTVESVEPKPTNTDKEQVNKFNSNFLYEENLGFIPGTLRGKQDPRYVFAKFPKKYKNFEFTNEDFLEIIEEADLLQYLELLQISKTNKSLDIRFRTEYAADFFVLQHIEVRGKPIPFIRKAMRVLKVVIKGVHPEMTNDELMMELMPFIEHASSMKTGNRWYLVFYKDQPVPDRRPPQPTPVAVEAPSAEESNTQYPHPHGAGGARAGHQRR